MKSKFIASALSVGIFISVPGLTAQTPARKEVPAVPASPAKPQHSAIVTKAMAQVEALDTPPPSPNIAPQPSADEPRVLTDSATARMDIAQRLLHMAEWFRRNGEEALALDAGNRALRHLDAAESMTDPVKQRAMLAQRHELAGMINERIKQDAAAASAHYSAAKQADASPFAESRLKRLNPAASPNGDTRAPAGNETKPAPTKGG